MILDDAVQLHEVIRIIYVVDGYEATLYTHDESTPVCGCKGDTIDEAIDKLKAKVSKFKSLQDIRSL
jgi:hypothetical protein